MEKKINNFLVDNNNQNINIKTTKIQNYFRSGNELIKIKPKSMSKEKKIRQKSTSQNKESFLCGGFKENQPKLLIRKLPDAFNVRPLSQNKNTYNERSISNRCKFNGSSLIIDGKNSLCDIKRKYKGQMRIRTDDSETSKIGSYTMTNLTNSNLTTTGTKFMSKIFLDKIEIKTNDIIKNKETPIISNKILNNNFLDSEVVIKRRKISENEDNPKAPPFFKTNTDTLLKKMSITESNNTNNKINNFVKTETNNKTFRFKKNFVINKNNRGIANILNEGQIFDDEKQNGVFCETSSLKIKEKFDEMIKKIKKVDNLSDGITYKVSHGFKYYFHFPSVESFFLKELKYSVAKNIKKTIKLWNDKFFDSNDFLKIYQHILNLNESYLTYVIEYPLGGESLYDIIDSAGFININLLHTFIFKMYDYFDIIKKESYIANYYFCLCDVFLNINEKMQIMPPVISLVQNNSLNNISNLNKNLNEECLCKKYLRIIQNLYNISNEKLYFFSLGFAFLQIITQNYIFKLKSFKYLTNENNNIGNLKKCCFLHTLTTLELHYNKKSELLLINFLNKYPKRFVHFIHECTLFDNKINKININILKEDNSSLNNQIEPLLSVREILKIVSLSANTYCTLDAFLQKFELLFNSCVTKTEEFNKLLHKKKIISLLARAFNIDKEEMLTKILNIIEKPKNLLIIEDN